MPPEVAQIRREICERENCPHLETLNFDDHCAACPLGHWGRYSAEGCDDPNRVVSNLGDRIAAIAQPIARMIDAVAGTNVAGCGGCKQMQANLNAGMSIPDAIRHRLNP